MARGRGHMTSGLTGSSSAMPRLSELPAGMHDSAADELRANAAAEDGLVRDALRRVGEPMPDPTHARFATVPTMDDLLAGSDLTPRRHTYVPVGTQVVTGAGPGDQWTVVGAGEGQLHLAQRTADDTGFTLAKRGWAELVERNPVLLDAFPRDVQGAHWVPVGLDPTEVAAVGRAAKVDISPMHLVELAGMAGTSPPTVATTWGDLVDETALAQRVPTAARPGGVTDVLMLRDVVGDRQFVSSAIGEPYGIRDVVTGTNALEGRAGAVLADAREMQDWFHRTSGIDIWGPGREALFTTDKRDFLANAAAGALGGDSFTYEGPRSSRVRGDWLGAESGELGQRMRWVNALLRTNDVAVRTHEAGHVATMVEWGNQVERLAPEVAYPIRAEDSIVQEAVSDLFGAARTGKPTVGVRDLGRLANGWGSYDQLTALMAATPEEHFDVHVATQLVTKPMARMLKEFGGDHLSEITGAAVRDVGRQLMSKPVEAVDIPMMAKALRDATAWRHGADSAIVAHLDDVWRTLGVLR